MKSVTTKSGLQLKKEIENAPENLIKAMATIAATTAEQLSGNMGQQQNPMCVNETSKIDFVNIKREKLLDIIRRVIANPENAKEVAEEVSRDWLPLIHVDEHNEISFIIGGRSR